MPTTIPLISEIPSPTDSRAQFSAKAFTMASELNPVITAMNAQATENNAAAVAAASSASAAVSAKTAAEAAASTAASMAGAEEWVNGATYTQGEVVWSPFSLLSYRRRTNGTSTVDPAFDRENWEPLTRDGVGEVVVLPSGTTAAQLYATHCFNGAASVLTLPADPKVGEWVAIAFTAAPVSGQTIDRNGKLIMGLAENLTLNVQQAFRLVYTGSEKGWGIATANVTAVVDNEALPEPPDALVNYNLEFSSSYTTVHGGGALLGPRYLSGTITPAATDWYRLCSFPSDSNLGHAVEFYFVIPYQHVVLKVSFGKTTRVGNYGGGILEVELLGSWEYGWAYPYDWRVVDHGVNESTHIDIRFNSGNASQVSYQIHMLHTLTNGGDISFPLSSRGSASGTGITNYGFSMGSGTGEGWTTQKFKLNATNGAYVAESNNFTRTTGTAIAM